MSIKGTPKYLDEAIHNGLQALVVPGESDTVDNIREHVLEYLAQKFSVIYALCEDRELPSGMTAETIWKSIKARKPDPSQKEKT